jgi:phosphoribosylamine--glycine ligase
MRLLLIGSGGREHALAWSLGKSQLVDRLFVAPGNPGISELAECVALDPLRFSDVIAFCRENKVDLVVIGPEGPLVAGLVDALEASRIHAFGPTKAAAALEGSKGFTKELCRERQIPTAEFARFTELEPALAYIRRQGAPIVVKADGLAAGKGVIVAMSEEEAEQGLQEIFAGRFGSAGHSVVIEEFLEGEEASFFALVDGTDILPLAGAQDHKRVGEGETGPNTGGMGAYSPAPVLTAAIVEEIIARIIRPTVQGMAARGTPFRGFLYAGLMLTDSGPKLIEYNVRLGDPEAQVILPRLTSDLAPALLACCEGRLQDVAFNFSAQTALTVVLAAKGYPGEPRRGGEIGNIAKVQALPHVHVFHAGTALDNGRLVATGGRVLNVTGLGEDLAQARERAYAAAAMIAWQDGFYRRDIGWRALAPAKR